MLDHDAIREFHDAFRARLDNSGPEECAHAVFPETTDDASVQLQFTLTDELGAALMSGANVETLSAIAIHAFATAMAWGFGLGALSMADGATVPDSIPTGDSSDPSVRSWQNTIREVGGNDWLE
jgi:hypothetical protein